MQVTFGGEPWGGRLGCRGVAGTVGGGALGSSSSLDAAAPSRPGRRLAFVALASVHPVGAAQIPPWTGGSNPHVSTYCVPSPISPPPQ